MTRYACVDAQEAAGFPVTAACVAVEVSTSGFYGWRQRQRAEPTPRQVGDSELVELMREIHVASDGAYGVPRMYTALRKAGVIVNRKKMRRLMRRHGIWGRVTLRRPRTTIPDGAAGPIPDLVGRRFAPGAADAAWVQDIERHEALSNRAVVKGHRHRLVAAGRLKLRAA